jgi:WASH complex subunit 7
MYYCVFLQGNKGNPNGYPYERAETIKKDIRKMGLVDGGLTSLEHFRHLISEMGNALGIVRMVRSGGLHYSSSACGYALSLYKIGKIRSFNIIGH